MLEVKETSPAGDLKYGNTTVGTDAVQVSPNSVTLVRGLLLRSPGAADPVPNTDVVHIGLGSVTADSTATGGIPLVPGPMALSGDSPRSGRRHRRGRRGRA